MSNQSITEHNKTSNKTDSVKNTTTSPSNSQNSKINISESQAKSVDEHRKTQNRRQSAETANRDGVQVREVTIDNQLTQNSALTQQDVQSVSEDINQRRHQDIFNLIENLVKKKSKKKGGIKSFTNIPKVIEIIQESLEELDEDVNKAQSAKGLNDIQNALEKLVISSKGDQVAIIKAGSSTLDGKDNKTDDSLAKESEISNTKLEKNDIEEVSIVKNLLEEFAEYKADSKKFKYTPDGVKVNKEVFQKFLLSKGLGNSESEIITSYEVVQKDINQIFSNFLESYQNCLINPNNTANQLLFLSYYNTIIKDNILNASNDDIVGFCNYLNTNIKGELNINELKIDENIKTGSQQKNVTINYQLEPEENKKAYKDNGNKQKTDRRVIQVSRKLQLFDDNFFEKDNANLQIKSAFVILSSYLQENDLTINDIELLTKDKNHCKNLCKLEEFDDIRLELIRNHIEAIKTGDVELIKDTKNAIISYNENGVISDNVNETKDSNNLEEKEKVELKSETQIRHYSIKEVQKELRAKLHDTPYEEILNCKGNDIYEKCLNYALGENFVLDDSKDLLDNLIKEKFNSYIQKHLIADFEEGIAGYFAVNESLREDKKEEFVKIFNDVFVNNVYKFTNNELDNIKVNIGKKINFTDKIHDNDIIKDTQHNFDYHLYKRFLSVDNHDDLLTCKEKATIELYDINLNNIQSTDSNIRLQEELKILNSIISDKLSQDDISKLKELNFSSYLLDDNKLTSFIKNTLECTQNLNDFVNNEKMSIFENFGFKDFNEREFINFLKNIDKLASEDFILLKNLGLQEILNGKTFDANNDVEFEAVNIIKVLLNCSTLDDAKDLCQQDKFNYISFFERQANFNDLVILTNQNTEDFLNNIKEATPDFIESKVLDSINSKIELRVNEINRLLNNRGLNINNFLDNKDDLYITLLESNSREFDLLKEFLTNISDSFDINNSLDNRILNIIKCNNFTEKEKFKNKEQNDICYKYGTNIYIHYNEIDNNAVKRLTDKIGECDKVEFYYIQKSLNLDKLKGLDKLKDCDYKEAKLLYKMLKCDSYEEAISEYKKNFDFDLETPVGRVQFLSRWYSLTENERNIFLASYKDNNSGNSFESALNNKGLGILYVCINDFEKAKEYITGQIKIYSIHKANDDIKDLKSWNKNYDANNMSVSEIDNEKNREFKLVNYNSFKNAISDNFYSKSEIDKIFTDEVNVYKSNNLNVVLGKYNLTIDDISKNHNLLVNLYMEANKDDMLVIIDGFKDKIAEYFPVNNEHHNFVVDVVLAKNYDIVEKARNKEAGRVLNKFNIGNLKIEQDFKNFQNDLKEKATESELNILSSSYCEKEINKQVKILDKSQYKLLSKEFNIIVHSKSHDELVKNINLNKFLRVENKDDALNFVIKWHDLSSQEKDNLENRLKELNPTLTLGKFLENKGLQNATSYLINKENFEKYILSYVEQIAKIDASNIAKSIYSGVPSGKLSIDNIRKSIEESKSFDGSKIILSYQNILNETLDEVSAHNQINLLKEYVSKTEEEKVIFNIEFQNKHGVTFNEYLANHGLKDALKVINREIDIDDFNRELSITIARNYGKIKARIFETKVCKDSPDLYTNDELSILNKYTLIACEKLEKEFNNILEQSNGILKSELRLTADSDFLNETRILVKKLGYKERLYIKDKSSFVPNEYNEFIELIKDRISNNLLTDFGKDNLEKIFNQSYNEGKIDCEQKLANYNKYISKIYQTSSSGYGPSSSYLSPEYIKKINDIGFGGDAYREFSKVSGAQELHKYNEIKVYDSSTEVYSHFNAEIERINSVINPKDQKIEIVKISDIDKMYKEYQEANGDEKNFLRLCILESYNNLTDAEKNQFCSANNIDKSFFNININEVKELLSSLATKEASYKMTKLKRDLLGDDYANFEQFDGELEYINGIKEFLFNSLNENFPDKYNSISEYYNTIHDATLERISYDKNDSIIVQFGYESRFDELIPNARYDSIYKDDDRITILRERFNSLFISNEGQRVSSKIFDTSFSLGTRIEEYKINQAKEAAKKLLDSNLTKDDIKRILLDVSTIANYKEVQFYFENMSPGTSFNNYISQLRSKIGNDFQVETNHYGPNRGNAGIIVLDYQFDDISNIHNIIFDKKINNSEITLEDKVNEALSYESPKAFMMLYELISSQDNLEKKQEIIRILDVILEGQNQDFLNTHFIGEYDGVENDCDIKLLKLLAMGQENLSENDKILFDRYKEEIFKITLAKSVEDYAKIIFSGNESFDNLQLKSEDFKELASVLFGERDYDNLLSNFVEDQYFSLVYDKINKYSKEYAQSKNNLKDSIQCEKVKEEFEKFIEKQLNIIKSLNPDADVSALQERLYTTFDKWTEFYSEKIDEASQLVKNAKDAVSHRNTERLYDIITNINKDPILKEYFLKIYEDTITFSDTGIKYIGNERNITFIEDIRRSFKLGFTKNVGEFFTEDYLDDKRANDAADAFECLLNGDKATFYAFMLNNAGTDNFFTVSDETLIKVIEDINNEVPSEHYLEEYFKANEDYITSLYPDEQDISKRQSLFLAQHFDEIQLKYTADLKSYIENAMIRKGNFNDVKTAKFGYSKGSVRNTEEFLNRCLSSKGLVQERARALWKNEPEKADAFNVLVELEKGNSKDFCEKFEKFAFNADGTVNLERLNQLKDLAPQYFESKSLQQAINEKFKDNQEYKKYALALSQIDIKKDPYAISAKCVKLDILIKDNPNNAKPLVEFFGISNVTIPEGITNSEDVYIYIQEYISNRVNLNQQIIDKYNEIHGKDNAFNKALQLAGYDETRQKIVNNVVNRGHLSKVERIYIATMNSVGTDENTLKEIFFEDLSRDELLKIYNDFKELTGKDLNEVLKSELSANDEFDILWYANPNKTIEDTYHHMEQLLEREKFSVVNLVHETEVYKKMQEDFKEFKAKYESISNEDRQLYINDTNENISNDKQQIINKFKEDSKNFEASALAYRTQKEQIANTTVQVVEWAGVAVITVATFGGATAPTIIIISAASGAAQIVSKAAIKGINTGYGGGEFAVDFAKKGGETLALAAGIGAARLVGTPLANSSSNLMKFLGKSAEGYALGFTDVMITGEVNLLADTDFNGFNSFSDYLDALCGEQASIVSKANTTGIILGAANSVLNVRKINEQARAKNVTRKLSSKRSTIKSQEIEKFADYEHMTIPRENVPKDAYIRTGENGEKFVRVQRRVKVDGRYEIRGEDFKVVKDKSVFSKRTTRGSINNESNSRSGRRSSGTSDDTVNLTEEKSAVRREASKVDKDITVEDSQRFDKKYELGEKFEYTRRNGEKATTVNNKPQAVENPKDINDFTKFNKQTERVLTEEFNCSREQFGSAVEFSVKEGNLPKGKYILRRNLPSQAKEIMKGLGSRKFALISDGNNTKWFEIVESVPYASAGTGISNSENVNPEKEDETNSDGTRVRGVKSPESLDEFIEDVKTLLPYRKTTHNDEEAEEVLDGEGRVIKKISQLVELLKNKASDNYDSNEPLTNAQEVLLGRFRIALDNLLKYNDDKVSGNDSTSSYLLNQSEKYISQLIDYINSVNNQNSDFTNSISEIISDFIANFEDNKTQIESNVEDKTDSDTKTSYANSSVVIESTIGNDSTKPDNHQGGNSGTSITDGSGSNQSGNHDDSGGSSGIDANSSEGVNLKQDFDLNSKENVTNENFETISLNRKVDINNTYNEMIASLEEMKKQLENGESLDNILSKNNLIEKLETYERLIYEFLNQNLSENQDQLKYNIINNIDTLLDKLKASETLTHEEQLKLVNQLLSVLKIENQLIQNYDLKSEDTNTQITSIVNILSNVNNLSLQNINNLVISDDILTINNEIIKSLDYITSNNINIDNNTLKLLHTNLNILSSYLTDSNISQEVITEAECLTIHDILSLDEMINKSCENNKLQISDKLSLILKRNENNIGINKANNIELSKDILIIVYSDNDKIKSIISDIAKNQNLSQEVLDVFERKLNERIRESISRIDEAYNNYKSYNFEEDKIVDVDKFLEKERNKFIFETDEEREVFKTLLERKGQISVVYSKYNTTRDELLESPKKLYDLLLNIKYDDLLFIKDDIKEIKNKYNQNNEYLIFINDIILIHNENDLLYIQSNEYSKNIQKNINSLVWKIGDLINSINNNSNFTNDNFINILNNYANDLFTIQETLSNNFINQDDSHNFDVKNLLIEKFNYISSQINNEVNELNNFDNKNSNEIISNLEDISKINIELLENINELNKEVYINNKDTFRKIEEKEKIKLYLNRKYDICSFEHKLSEAVRIFEDYIHTTKNNSLNNNTNEQQTSNINNKLLIKVNELLKDSNIEVKDYIDKNLSITSIKYLNTIDDFFNNLINKVNNLQISEFNLDTIYEIFNNIKFEQVIYSIVKDNSEQRIQLGTQLLNYKNCIIDLKDNVLNSDAKISNEISKLSSIIDEISLLSINNRQIINQIDIEKIDKKFEIFSESLGSLTNNNFNINDATTYDNILHSIHDINNEFSEITQHLPRESTEYQRLNINSDIISLYVVRLNKLSITMEQLLTQDLNSIETRNTFDLVANEVYSIYNILSNYELTSEISALLNKLRIDVELFRNRILLSDNKLINTDNNNIHTENDSNNNVNDINNETIINKDKNVLLSNNDIDKIYKIDELFNNVNLSSDNIVNSILTKNLISDSSKISYETKLVLKSVEYFNNLAKIFNENDISLNSLIYNENDDINNDLINNHSLHLTKEITKNKLKKFRELKRKKEYKEYLKLKVYETQRYLMLLYLQVLASNSNNNEEKGNELILFLNSLPPEIKKIIKPKEVLKKLFKSIGKEKLSKLLNKDKAKEVILVLKEQ